MSNHKISFSVPGRIGGKQRAGRQIEYRHNAKAVIRSFNPRKTESQEAIVRQLAALEMRRCRVPLIEGPINLEITSTIHTPRSWSAKRKAAARWVTTKPDADNQAKLIADSMRGICMHDDAQVARLLVEQRYDDSCIEAVTITMEALS